MPSKRKYRGKLCAYCADEVGMAAADSLRKKFDYLSEKMCSVFSEPAFEKYYPTKFQASVSSILGMADKRERREAKSQLLKDVLAWSLTNAAEARIEWETSAAEVIDFLKEIEVALASA